MAQNFKAPGDVLTLLNTSKGATVPSGTSFIFGTRAGVAIADIADDAEGAVAVEGVFEFTIGSSAAIALGEPVYVETEGTDIVSATAAVALLGKALTITDGTEFDKILVRLEGSV
jgi:predicted RecA/RadA family phage recombinase